jgi:alpha-glucosidase
LGIIRSDGDFSSNLSPDLVSDVQSVSDTSTVLHGKRLMCTYSGNNRVFFFRNAVSKKLEIILQVSNDGVAFRCYFPGETDTTLKIFKEETSFHFDLSTKAFLRPCDDARVGYAGTFSFWQVLDECYGNRCGHQLLRIATESVFSGR